MKRWLFLLLLFSAFPAQADKGTIYYVTPGYCESMSAEGSLACLQSDFDDLEIKMMPGESAICQGDERNSKDYCVLTRWKDSGKEFVHDSYYWWIHHKTKTCMKVENVLHSGVTDGIEGIIREMHYLRAPKGKKAETYFPDEFDRCENNCTIHYHAFRYEDGSLVLPIETDGTSRKGFRKTQTGEVCAAPSPKSESRRSPKRNGWFARRIVAFIKRALNRRGIV